MSCRRAHAAEDAAAKATAEAAHWKDVAARASAESTVAQVSPLSKQTLWGRLGPFGHQTSIVLIRYLSFVPHHVRASTGHVLAVRAANGRRMQVRPGRGQQLLREKAAEIETHLAEIKRLQVCDRMQPAVCA